jgi:hypothetical protein
MARKTTKSSVKTKRKRRLSANQIAHRVYLKSAKWKKVKDEFRRSSFFRGKCFICNKTWKLQIHHLTYDHWMDERPEELIELCSCCHKNIHAAERKGIPFSKIINQLRDLGLVTISL